MNISDSGIASIVLAGGCFWGIEKLYRSFRGVRDVTAGYANGRSETMANYNDVCSGISGFREAVKIIYDPNTISLGTILDIFFRVIDPTMFNRQGMDIGSQYQTGIYWTEPEDEAYIRQRADEERKQYREFYTEFKALLNFYPAEEYHQRYLEKNPGGYCHISSAKIERLLKEYNTKGTA